MNKILLLLFIALLACNANAEVYKWVDSTGKVQYGDQPPSNNKTKKLKVEASPSAVQSTGSEKAPAAKSMMDKEIEFRKRRVESEEAQKKQDKQANETKQKQENCINARGNLRGLQESGRIVKYDEKGERAFLDDDARQQAIERAQKEVDTWCK